MIKMHLRPLLNIVLELRGYPPIKALAYDMGVSRQVLYRIIQEKPVSPHTAARLIHYYVSLIHGTL